MFVKNGDEGKASIITLDPLSTAVIDKRFEYDLTGLAITPDSTATIVMTEYKPNKVTYKAKAASEQLAVFSEIYYPHGWEAYVDGKEVPHVRADWTLRAMRVPAGEHEIIFKFEPKGYHLSSGIASVASAILLLLTLGMIVLPYISRKKKSTDKE